MKKRKPAIVIALLILTLALSSCQMFNRSSATMAEPAPFPNYTPQIQLAKQASDDLKQKLPMPADLRAYDHDIYASTTPNPREEYTTTYTFAIDVSEYFGHYSTRITIKLSPRGESFGENFDLSLFKNEGQFLWNALKTSHGITDENIDEALKKIGEKIAAGEKPKFQFGGIDYIPKDLPGFEFSYVPPSIGGEHSLDVSINNRVPDDKAAQETAIDYLADAVIGGVVAQGVPIDYIKSSFYWAKADRSNDLIYTTEMRHSFQDDFKTYKTYTRNYELSLSADNAADPNAIQMDEKEQKKYKNEIFDEKLVYNGKKNIITFRKPMTVAEFAAEVRNQMNNPNFSPEIKTQINTYLDNRQLEIPTFENCFSTTEHSEDELTSIYYLLANSGFSFSFDIETTEKLPSVSSAAPIFSPETFFGTGETQENVVPNQPTPQPQQQQQEVIPTPPPPPQPFNPFVNP